MRNTVRTEIYVGGSAGWVDASADARQEAGHTITRVDGDPGRLDFTLSSPDGRWSPRNPASPHYGLLGRNSLVRVGVELHAETFDGPTLAGSWGTDWLHAAVGGTLDQPAQWGRTGGYVWHRVPVTAGYRMSWYIGQRYADCEFRTSFTAPANVTGGSLEPANVLLRLQDASTYYMARVEILTTEAVQVSIHHSTAGLIAAAVVATATLNAGQQWQVAASCTGDRLAAKAWPASQPEPRDWQVTGADTRITAPGYVGIRSGVAGDNTNALPVEMRYYGAQVIDRRAVMEMSEPVPQSTTNGADSWVTVTASGITRRLGQGAKPLDSALTRRIPGTSPAAWWPLEEGRDATRGASGIPGHPSLLAADTSTVGFGGDGPDGAAAGLAPRNGAAPRLAAVGPAGITPDSFTVSMWIRGGVEDLTKVAVAQPFGWTSAGERWQVTLTSGTEDAITGVVDPNFYRVSLGLVTESASSGLPAFNVRVLDGQWHLLSFGLQQQGADVAGWLYVDGVQRGADWIPATTLRAPETWTVGASAAANVADYGLSHLQVHNGPFSPDEVQAGAGYVGERAADRFGRLCQEQGVPYLITRGPELTQPMGPQRPAQLLDLLRECVDVDGGIMGEAREQLALTFVCIGALYNRPAVPLTYAHLAPPLTPVPDDRDTRNDVTVKRTAGAAHRTVRTDGPLGTAAVGVYDTAVTVAAAHDSQLPDQSGWRVHVGTWDEARYATLRVNLAQPVWAGAGQLADTVTALEAGGVLELSELPAWLPPGPVALQVRGTVETLGQYTRGIDFTLRPAGPYTVALADGPARAGADGSLLAGGLSTSGTSLLIASTVTNGPWSEDPADFPLAVRVGAERVTVSGISRSFVEAFGRTTAAGGWDSPWAVSSGAASAFSVDGSQGVISMTAVNTEYHVTYDVLARTQDVRIWYTLPILPTGAPVSAGILLRYTDPANYLWADAQTAPDGTITVRLTRRVNGIGELLRSGPTIVGYAGGTPRLLRAEVNGVTFRARVRTVGTEDPLDWDVSVTDPTLSLSNGSRAGCIARLMSGNTNALPYAVRFDNVSTAQPQLATITARGVNGVQRSWPAATDVQVWHPGVAPL